MSYPEGNFVISLSGGRTSAFLLLECLRRWGPVPDRGLVCFQNTGKEHEKTLEFIQKISDYSQIQVHWIEFYQERKYKPLFKEVNFEKASRNGEPLTLAMEFSNWHLPSKHRRFCTRKTKFETLKRYLKNKGWRTWHNLVGIRFDEPARWEGKDGIYGKSTSIYPLVDWKVDQLQVLEYWKSMPFDLELPRISGRNFLGNCGGCFLKSELDLALLCKYDRDEFLWWEWLEESTGFTFKDGWSYRELREKVESGSDKFKIGGYFCQSNDGECTGV